MNLAAIIIQLISLCDVTSKLGHRYICNQFMIQCAQENYNKQQVESVVDICTKKYLKEK